MIKTVPGRRVASFLIAAFLAAGLPLLARLFVMFASGTFIPFLEESEILLYNSFWAAAPFLVFAVLAFFIKRFNSAFYAASITGLVITVVFWSWIAAESALHQAGVLGGGVNIGLGLILLVLPLVVFIAMTIVVFVRGAPS